MPLPPNAPNGIALQTPPRIQVAKYVRNGLIPHALFETELASSTDFVGACCTKELFRSHGGITAIPTSTASVRTRWRFAAHTSPLLRKIRFLVYMAKQNNGDPVFAPKATLTITNANESVTYGSATAYFGAASAANTEDVPSEFGYVEVELFGVPAGTTVYGRIEEDDTARIISATVYEEALEVTDANGYIVPSALAVGSPILDARHRDLYVLARNLWRHQGAHLLNWTVDNQASPQTNASGTVKNIVDLSTSGASGPSWRLDTRYCGTRARPTVAPVLWAVYAKMSGPSDTGEVDLTGVNGGFYASVNVTGTTAQWYTTTFGVAADLDDYYVEFANPDFGTGAGETISVYAMSLFQLA